MQETKCIIASFLILSCWIGSVFAQQIPHLIKYHGTLPKQAEGPPGNPPGQGGTPPGKGGMPPGQENQPKIYTLTFRIYNTETSGLALWKETHSNVLVEKDKFEVILGTISPLDLKFDEDYWLSIEIDNKREFSLREKMTSFSYAYMSEDSWKLGGRYADDYALMGHSHIGDDIVTPVLEAINADTVDGLHADQIGGIRDHGLLEGLSDDDHLQYLNNLRGDERYAGSDWDGLTRLKTAQEHIADKNNPHVVTLEQLGHIDNNPEEEAPTVTERGEPTGTEIQEWADDITAWGHTNLVTNLNADMVDGLHATGSDNPKPNTLLALDAEGKFPSSVIPSISGLWADAGTYIYPDNAKTNLQIKDDTGDLVIGDNIDVSLVDSRIRALFVHHNGVLGQFMVDEDSVGVQSISNHPLRLKTNDITRMTIATSGNVGIGTSNPDAKLTVVGTSGDIIRADGDTNASWVRIEARNLDGINPDKRVGLVAYGSGMADLTTVESIGAKLFKMETVDAMPLALGTAGIERLRVNPDGDVGIGTQNPQNTLHIKGGVGLQSNYPEGSGQGGTWNFGVDVEGRLLVNANTPAPGGDPIMVMEDNSANIVMGIKDGNKGNLGIGINNPSERLHVNGYVKAQGYKTGDIIFEKDGQSLWRMFEDEEGLYVRNLKTGKVYKLALQEVASE